VKWETGRSVGIWDRERLLWGQKLPVEMIIEIALQRTVRAAKHDERICPIAITSMERT